MKSTFLILLILFFSALSIDAQIKSDKYRPSWMSSLPQKHAPSYIFEIANGMGATLDEARQKSFLNLTTKMELERGIAVESYMKVDQNMHRVMHLDHMNERNTTDVENITYNQSYVIECSEKGKNISLLTRAVDEYWEQTDHGYVCYVLYTVADKNYSGGSYDDDIYLTSKYPVKGLWRSAIIPGWGQFYKGDKLKGGLLLGGCAALAGGLIFTQSQRSDYISKRNNTNNVKLKKNYITKIDHFTTARNIFIGATAALYVYNLVDAITAAGARRLVVKPRNGRPLTYSVIPTVSKGGSCLTASIYF